jgi:exonuclease III
VPLLPPARLELDDPPAATLATLERLEEALDDDDIPPKRDGENLLIATWNIKALARVTKRWTASDSDNPKRNLLDLCCIATIMSRFDVIALVEVKREMEALRLLMEILGPKWGFIVSDVTEGTGGNTERLGYVFDLDRVRPSGMAGELVIPDDELKLSDAVLKEQFDRTPYKVSFSSKEDAFTLVSLHIVFGERASDRTPELGGFARWMRDHAEDEDEFNRNLIALGDFNIDRRDDPYWLAFASTGLGAPIPLQEARRNIAASSGGTDKYYDQIAWFQDGNLAKLTLEYRMAGSFLWTDYILQGLTQSLQEGAHLRPLPPLGRVRAQLN